MDFKLSEILTIVAVLLLPVGAFTFIFWPGAFGALMGVINSPAGLPVAAGIVVACAVAAIVVRRLPRRRKPGQDEAEDFSSFWRNLWRG